ncbi:MAG: hypothetical protein ABS951_14530 [Solibacillus sp.]
MDLKQYIEQSNYAYDFKNESPNDAVRQEQNALKKFLKYKLDSESFDCDSSELAKACYQQFWGLSEEELATYDSDTMNSFYRIYRLLILAYDREQKYLRWHASGVTEYKARYQWLLDEYKYYIKINEHEAVQKFAALTHSIGNFTLVPKGFNTKRNQLLHDYWDLTLLYFKEQLGAEAFEQEVEKYCYESAYLDNGKVLTYWEGHTIHNKALPRQYTSAEIIAVIEKMNTAIEIRGKEILEYLQAEIQAELTVAMK